VDQRPLRIGCLDDPSSHELITWHFGPYETSTEFSDHCDILLVQHFDPVTFYYCDIISWDILLLWYFDPVTIYCCDISPVTFYTVMLFDPCMIHPGNGCPAQFYILSKMWIFCHMSPGHTLSCFALVAGGLIMCHNGWIIYHMGDWCIVLYVFYPGDLLFSVGLAYIPGIQFYFWNQGSKWSQFIRNVFLKISCNVPLKLGLMPL
jgi:hypothetical protein